MKRLKIFPGKIILIPILIIALGTNMALPGQSIRKSYHFDHPTVNKTGDYTEISFQGTSFFGETGKAVLPFQPVVLLLPPGESASDIRIEYSDPVEMTGNFVLRPQQEYRPVSYEGRPVFIKDEAFYSSGKAYPERGKKHFRTDFMNGYGFVMTAFTPLDYIPSEGKVTYYRTVNVKVDHQPDARAGRALNNFKQTPSISSRVSSLAQNPEELYAYAGNASRTGDAEYRYLIITGDAFVPEFDTLMDFYYSRGIRSRCFSLGHIDTAAAGTDMPEKIRNFILDAYQNHGVEYVLLGGDVDIVPYRGFYCSVFSGGGYYTDANIPSDLYFSSLDGTWNDNNNSWWGEVGEDDLLPEVAVGRLTFSDTDELHHMLHKIFSYQDSPVVEDLDRPLLVGEYLYGDPVTWGSDYMRLLVGHQTYNGYTTDGIPPGSPIDSLYDRYSGWNNARLMDSINSGHAYVHHVGHANSGYVMKLSTSDITNANFAGANGIDHINPVVYTHGCICGAFDYSVDCIAEKMIGIDNFAVAFVGNSRYGWFVEGTCDGPSEHLHREFIDAIYSDSLYRIGMAHMRSKAETAPFVDLEGEYEPGAHRWCFYDCNVLGDPMMALWTEQPHDVAVDFPPMIPIGCDTLTLTVSYNGAGQKAVLCALFQSDSLLGSSESDASGVCRIPLGASALEGEAQLVVSGLNVSPKLLGLTVADYWMGMTEDWDDPENWATGRVPDDSTDVIIPADPSGNYFPVMSTKGKGHSRKLYIEPGAFLHLGENDTLFIHSN